MKAIVNQRQNEYYILMLIDLFDEEEENPDTFVSFIVFEPASLRIPDNDLLLLGDDVTNLFENVMQSEKFEANIQDQILINRLQRIEMMIDLLKSNDGLILTKFLNKIWRRYAFFSNLGELFITVKDLKRLAPDFKFNNTMILDRVVESDEPIEDTSDEGSDDTTDDTSTNVETKTASSSNEETP